MNSTVRPFLLLRPFRPRVVSLNAMIANTFFLDFFRPWIIVPLPGPQQLITLQFVHCGNTAAQFPLIRMPRAMGNYDTCDSNG